MAANTLTVEEPLGPKAHPMGNWARDYLLFRGIIELVHGTDYVIHPRHRDPQGRLREDRALDRFDRSVLFNLEAEEPPAP